MEYKLSEEIDLIYSTELDNMEAVAKVQRLINGKRKVDRNEFQRACERAMELVCKAHNKPTKDS